MDQNHLWWRDGIIYQIYPRSFADSNNDGIGDLPGIISKLDYLQDLGIDGLWLSPIYPSPDIDFGYDVANYTDIDPKFGTMEDFDLLVKEAKQRGIRIILDLVLNHTSDQHPWFIESRKSTDNPYHDWYIWRDPKPDGSVPNNWRSIFGGSAWEFDPVVGQYYYHMFYKEQPDVNWRNPEVRAAMLDVFHFWLKKGVSGFRLDVFNAYFKDPEFKDNPPKLGIRPFDWQEHLYDISQPEMRPLLNEIRSIVDQYPQAYLVGETFISDAETTAGYIGKDQLHAAFNFEFADNRWHPRQFLRSIRKWYQALDDEDWPNNVLSNHDIPRTATRYCFGEDDRRAKVAAALLLTIRGTPFIYYGEEIGMRDIPVRRKKDVKDPMGKTFWPLYKGRDGCRSPMQWRNMVHAGFSDTAPWLPVHKNYPQRNVEQQESNAGSLLNFFKQTIKLRRSEPALQKGKFISFEKKPRFVLSYLREYQQNQVLVILNFSSRELDYNLPNGNWSSLLEPGFVKTHLIDLEPYAVYILKKL